MRCHLAGLTARVLLAPCVMLLPSPGMAAAPPPIPVQQANRFNRAFQSGGMFGVADDVEKCHAEAIASRQQIQVRLCVVYDDFADRFAAQMGAQAHFPLPAFFQPSSVYTRLARYSRPAAFTDAYSIGGSNCRGDQQRRSSDYVPCGMNAPPTRFRRYSRPLIRLEVERRTYLAIFRFEVGEVRPVGRPRPLPATRRASHPASGGRKTVVAEVHPGRGIFHERVIRLTGVPAAVGP